MLSKEFLNASPISGFKNLKNLVITLPQRHFEERNEMWNVILGAAETLESLELCLSNAWNLGEVSLRFDQRGHEHADNVEVGVNGELTLMSPCLPGSEIALDLGEIDVSALLPTISSHRLISLITSLHNNI